MVLHCQKELSCPSVVVFFSQFQPDNLVNPITQNFLVNRVGVHLDKLEVFAVQVFVHEIIVKLQYTQLPELVNSDAALVRSSDGQSLFMCHEFPPGP